MIKSTKKFVANTTVDADRKSAEPSNVGSIAALENKPLSKRVSKSKAEKSKAEASTIAALASETTSSELPPDVSVSRTTKQDQILTLLTQTGGASIDEVMRATGWQEHSVRGFFAGTVRKKLGFDLTSAKQEGSERRYAIKIAA